MNTFISYHLLIAGTQRGPYTAAQIWEGLKAGQHDEHTLVCAEGDEQWLPLVDHPAFVSEKRPAAEPEVKQPATSPALDAPKLPAPMQICGAILFGVGFMMMIYFFMKETTRQVSASAWKLDEKNVHNIGLINDREVGVMFGGFLLVGGCVLLAGYRD